MTLLTKWSFVLNLGAAAWLGSATCASAPVAPGTDSAYLEQDQGWSVAEREQVHHLSFGSRVLPANWFRHLQLPGDESLLRSDGNLASLGFLPSARSASNPDALPIGFSEDRDDSGQDWIGLNCAACHTGAISYRGKRMLIEGGAALIDFSRFERQLSDSLAATLDDAGRFARFAAAVLPSPANDAAKRALKADIQQRIDYLQQRQRINHSDTPYGYGRLDAFGQIFNTVAVEFLGIAGNARPADAPVSYPFLWYASHLDLVQWNGSAPNSAPGPLIQNVTTALAVYGTAEVRQHSGLAGYPSSVELLNLGTFQDDYYRLEAPRWPESLLGPLDASRVARGQTLYAQHCERCHALSHRNRPDQKLQATLTPVDEIGTDATMASNFVDATAATGAMQGRKLMVLAGSTFGAEAPTVELVVNAAVGATLRHPVDAVRAALRGYHAVDSATANPKPYQYKARPLAGVWATAPFLHNGSVPTLHDLLLPPAQRPQRFYVGSREIDPVNVGFATGAGADRSLFDTALPGNGNQGHDYGTTLGDEDRYALIEYLKSL